MTVTIEIMPEQLEKIVVDELKEAIELCLLNGANASSFEEDQTDYELLTHQTQ